MDGILILNKPQCISSNTAARKAMRMLGAKKGGHAGTLDPMAQGVLVVLLGKATRLSEYAMDGKKEYVASIKFGIETDTLDIWGAQTNVDIPSFTSAQLEESLDAFIGDFEQIPPMYSAIKKGGVKMYELARKGQKVELGARHVNVERIELLGNGAPNSADVLLVCSKGFYVRSFCRDLAQSLGTIGVMSGLTRVRSGDFGIAHSYSFEDIEEAIGSGVAASIVKPCDSVLGHMPMVELEYEQAKSISNGRATRILGDEGLARCYFRGSFFAIGSIKSGTLSAKKVLFDLEAL
ncbi:MAG: tRNA pseudouridine(55) synthase TruB [Eubacteriaceae bacterium]|nr:tRNA pseudouridine(55) synthase TruB [Eubacteriaceae bacterium]